MDRISDSGSEDGGSNPFGATPKLKKKLRLLLRRDEKLIPLSRAKREIPSVSQNSCEQE